MKIYGYDDQGKEAEFIEPFELAEITLVATAEELRLIAKFLENAADVMQANPDTWQHEHLSDQFSSFRTSPHFVVFNPDAK